MAAGKQPSVLEVKAVLISFIFFFLLELGEESGTATRLSGLGGGCCELKKNERACYLWIVVDTVILRFWKRWHADCSTERHL